MRAPTRGFWLALGFSLGFSLAVGCASAPPYARCGDGTSCAMGRCTDVAFTRTDGTDAHGSFCSSACTSDADCPDDGACIALGHDASRTFFCVKRCATSADCTTPFACTTLAADDGTTLEACLP